jgi:hypothetical protein
MACVEIPRRISYPGAEAMANDSLPRLRRLAGRLCLAGLLLVALGSWRRGRLEPPAAILPALLRPPLQTATERGPFEFQYRGRACRVRPVASYELWGLVVTHNDIESVADIYHDRSSVDTKDLCVVWGDNLRREDYRRVKFWSGPFTCYFRIPDGARFALDGAANNHLIADRPEIRDAIAGVRVGDQVHLRGLLVDYQMDDWEGFWRRTSQARNDSDCEVLFVESLAVLRRGTPGWYLAHRLGWVVLIGGAVLWMGLFAAEAGRGTGSVGRI